MRIACQGEIHDRLRGRVEEKRRLAQLPVEGIRVEYLNLDIGTTRLSASEMFWLVRDLVVPVLVGDRRLSKQLLPSQVPIDGADDDPRRGVAARVPNGSAHDQAWRSVERAKAFQDLVQPCGGLRLHIAVQAITQTLLQLDVQHQTLSRPSADGVRSLVGEHLRELGKLLHCRPVGRFEAANDTAVEQQPQRVLEICYLRAGVADLDWCDDGLHGLLLLLSRESLEAADAGTAL
ncbi:MAG: hypothetical protein IPI02_11990 [Sterolibacteriaceae bacterium]|nr:hypothetical protein [Sterolibacteriaceae bacterium]